jgi:hypothetical protein
MSSVTEIRVMIIGINAWYRPPPNGWVMTTSPPPQPKPDYEYVNVNFVIEDVQETNVNLVIKKEDLRRMNLSVGDHAKLRIEPSQ